MALVSASALICPVCHEGAQDAPPSEWRVPGTVPAWSHSRDASALCDVIGPDGYVPADPVEVCPRTLTSDETRTLRGIDRNYGPFRDDGWTVGDVIELISALDRETGGELAWCDGAAILAYMRSIGCAR
ncbi:hypothetical protein Psed_7016 (plasmid) [Pseudonocardia dioxanivorans CB1190]|uniref:Uncharacterized protein n=1 Tax=Pseudonocardia dioxanivorans (strain ATCC 55486 / DSM 44775 / JCM 13855 / CB1190) TaxID=675635 RepID=F2L7A0_PSEUX|nr:hypothetical protein [Pseudonocardia dioxanivorans]AEA29073.1 hypothetical protein Psed_7016 [Pseudonocardia dioxanivorans CB1190]